MDKYIDQVIAGQVKSTEIVIQGKRQVWNRPVFQRTFKGRLAECIPAEITDLDMRVGLYMKPVIKDYGALEGI